MHVVKRHPIALELDLLSLSELNESRKDIRTVPFVFVWLTYIQDIRYGYFCLRYDIDI
jgi:hypothetical protein